MVRGPLVGFLPCIFGGNMCNISTKIGSGCDHEEKAGHVRTTAFS